MDGATGDEQYSPQDLLQLRQEVSRLQHVVKDQATELEKAWARVRELRSRIQVPAPLLKGKKIAVIGPSFRERCYRDLVCFYGGKCLFAPADKKVAQIDQVVSACDGGLYLTAYTSHKAGKHVKLAAGRYQKPIVYVDGTGLDRLEESLLNRLAPQMGISVSPGLQSHETISLFRSQG